MLTEMEELDIDKCLSIMLDFNRDYLSVMASDEYKLGCSLLYIYKMMKKVNLYEIAAEFRKRILALKIRKFSRKRYVNCKKFAKKTNSRIAVYKVIFGKYDTLYEPYYRDSQCDYFIITDSPVSTDSIWKPVEDKILRLTEGMSPAKRNRYYKMYPHKIFDEYKYTIYLDGNVEICGPVSDLTAYINPMTDMALHNMCRRDCAYDEAFACRLLGKGNPKQFDMQIKRYKKEGFPTHFGVYECMLLVRKNSINNKRIMNMWWREYLSSAGRDQVSLPYVIWKMGYQFDDVGFIGNDCRLNPYIRITRHRLAEG